MSELLQLTLILLAGMLLGAIFFGGLWWTVQKGLTAKQPALWFGVSLLLRSGIVLGGIYFVAGTDWKRMVVCLLGFIIARIVVLQLTRQHGNERDILAGVRPACEQGRQSHAGRAPADAVGSAALRANREASHAP